MKNFTEKYDRQMQRFLEILPGSLTWIVILLPLWGAFFIPQVIAYFTIVFLIFWFYRSFQSAVLGIKGYLKIRKSEKTNWQEKYLKDKKKDSLKWKEIKNVIIIPNYNESAIIIGATLETLIQQKDIDKKQLIVVLAMEERAAGAHERAQELLEKFKNRFGLLIATFHPDGIVGEIKGKASNEAWAAKEIKKLLVDKQKYDIGKITITSCDADAHFHPQYFSNLTYFFSLNPNRYLLFWQSPICCHNNFWKIPALIRITGTLSNSSYLASIQEPDGLFFNYSSYSTSLFLLDKVGYWDTDIIPEDWHIFLQSFFHEKGKVEVSAIFLPTSIDAPEGKTYFGALKNRYEQCKRHAWGATDIPYAIKEAFKHPEIPVLVRFFRVYKVLESHLLWSTNWFILTLWAWLPAWINPFFKQTALSYNLPKISQWILTICLVFLLIMIIIDRALRPKVAKQNLGRWFAFWEIIQWILMPIATLFMAVLPAVESQTRLMLGKRLEYKVTEKI
jgi:hypothetical protein